MKATLIVKPIEYGIEAFGEKWKQGEKLKAVMKLKNHGNEKIERPFLNVTLCSGNYKKVKAHHSEAWDIIIKIELLQNLTLNPNEEKEFHFEFLLPEDCRITDKDGSLYLAYQDNENENWPLGHMELVIDPKIVMKQFLEIFENFLRFKVGQIKYSKGMVEIKLKPPGSRELSHVDSLVLRMSEVNKTLRLEYLFNLRMLEMNGASRV